MTSELLRRRDVLMAAILFPLGLGLVACGLPVASIESALALGTLTALTALALSVPLWELALRLDWDRYRRVPQWAAHLLGAVCFSLLWLWLQHALNPLRVRSISETMMTRVASWQFAAGLCFYGVIMGVSHAARTQERAQRERRRAAEAEAAATSARLRALEARLRPHFLFNALHTVSALAGEDVGRAQEAIERLGDVLRYSLRGPERDMVALEQEIEFATMYLDFEQLRLGERLRVHRQVDSGALACLVPAFAVQTLVENAVHHAIVPRPLGGNLWLEVSRASEQVKVEVRDDGALPPALGPGLGAGFGLVALRERLLGAFGGDGAITVGASPEGGCQVRLSFPARLAESKA